MEYWPWWISGLALSGVMVLHWLLLHRMMAVSGRITSLVDRVRHGSTEPAAEMSPEEMMAAIQALTSEEFDPEDVTVEAPVVVDDAPSLPAAEARRTAAQHVLFLGGLIAGGAVATALSGGFTPELLRGEAFSSLTKGSPVLSGAILLLGGAFVGFGTRMSGGCTSGHGLCGTSRLQPGSLVATAAFFGAGIATSFALGAFL